MTERVLVGIAMVAILALALATPVHAQADDPSFENANRILEARLAEMAPSDPVQIDDEEAERRKQAIFASAFAAGFDGEILVSLKPNSFDIEWSPSLKRLGYGWSDKQAAVWPLASVTKQMIAFIVVKEAENDDFDLDAPASRYLEGFGSKHRVPTIRELLQHRSGLANPDSTPADGSGWPSGYSDGSLSAEWCLKDRKAPPTEGFSYNNCDYMVLGRILEEVTYTSLEDLVADGISNMGEESELGLLDAENIDRLVLIEEPERSVLPAYGAAGGLGGTLIDVAIFNNSMIQGHNLTKNVRDELWKPDPSLGGQALGQWVYEVQLTGCEKPLRIVERRGAIGRYQMLNVMLPDTGQQLVAATAQPEAEFDFGDGWMAGSFLYDSLAMLACGAGE